VQVPIHLEGGPCNGRNAVVTRSGDLLPGFTCRKVNYQPTSKVTPAGRVVYTTKASQSGGGDGGGAPVAVPAKAHKAWNTMLRTIFVDAPKELKHAHNARAALRRLRHRRGLR
jgi:hypothetical protein